MIVIKAGNEKDRYKIYDGCKFICDKCGCEWIATRSEVKFLPPFMEFGVYMACPNCKTTCYRNLFNDGED